MTYSSAGLALFEQLRSQGRRLVLAESCSGGLIAARLAEIPGISAVLCGSAVVYREATKRAWLEVPPEILDRYTAESPETTSVLARQVLQKSPEADLSLAITGHLGPDAPVSQDGRVHLAVWRRDAEELREVATETMQLATQDRRQRQQEAAERALQFLVQELGA